MNISSFKYSFYICYEKLCRNIERIIILKGYIFTDRMIYDFLSLSDNIENSSFDYVPFANHSIIYFYWF